MKREQNTKGRRVQSNQTAPFNPGEHGDAPDSTQKGGGRTNKVGPSGQKNSRQVRATENINNGPEGRRGQSLANRMQEGAHGAQNNVQNRENQTGGSGSSDPNSRSTGSGGDQKATAKPSGQPQNSQQNNHQNVAKNTTQNNRKPSKKSKITGWRNNQDPNFLYQLDKSIKMQDEVVDEIDQITLWRSKDIKGQRKTFYTKEIEMKNDKIMAIMDQTPLERLENEEDRWPCLNFRKSVKRFKIYVSLTAQAITKQNSFENLIILIIMFNCIPLALGDTTKEETEQDKLVELVFQILFTIEMVLRILASGFIFGKDAYLQQAWNILDFVCVVTGYISMFQKAVGGSEGGSSISGLRAFRVLRPLRSINKVEGLKVIMLSVMAALPLLKDTIIVLLFFFLIFAIGGVNMFMGMLMNRCVSIETGAPLFDDGEEVICADNSTCPGEGEYFCGKRTMNPNFDVTNFDNIFWALLVVFQCITLEGWSEIMVLYQIVYSYAVFIYFVPLVFIGAFFLLNLTLAVINSSFSETSKKIKAKKQKELEEANAFKNMGKQGNDDAGGQMGEDAEKVDITNIGVAEFYIAKRAARKLKEYTKKRLMLKAEEEAELARRRKNKQNNQGFEDDADMLMDQQSITVGQGRPMSPDQQKQRRESVIANRRSPEVKELNNSGALSPPGREMHQSLGVGLGGGTLKAPNQTELANLTKTLQHEPINEAYIEDEEFPNNVAQFFQDLKPAADQEKQRGNQNRKNNGEGPIMAYNEMRIVKSYGKRGAQGLNGKGGKNTDTSLVHFPPIQEPDARVMQANLAFDDERILAELDFDRVVNKQDAEGIQLATTRRDQSNQPTQQQNQQLRLSQEQLDAKRGEAFQKMTSPIMGGEVDMSSDGQHSFDLGFLKQVHYDVALSDDEGNQKSKIARNNKALDDHELAESVIQSDSSFSQNLRDLKNLNANQNEDTAAPRVIRKRQAPLVGNNAAGGNAGGIINADLKRPPQRMLTSDNQKQKEFNDTMGSTFIGFKDSVQQQVNLFSDLKAGPKSQADDLKKESGLQTGDKGSGLVGQRGSGAQTGQTNQNNNNNNPSRLQSAMSNKTEKRRKATRQIYEAIDMDYFKQSKPKDPLEFIDKKTQKVMLNPGVPYISTSQNEVFERRNKELKKQYMSQLNPFIEIVEQQSEEQDALSDDSDEQIIRIQCDPYQLKTRYEVKDVEEFEISDDDEDALILASQPYETVKAINYEDYLNALPTKFVARRSDIIVSSTLSITLTPIDDGFVPQNFAKIDNDQTEDYVRLRNEYRAFAIQTCKLPMVGARGIDMSIENSEDQQSIEDSQYDPSAIQSMFGSQVNASQRSPSPSKSMHSPLKKPEKLIPPTLLTEPLPPNKIAGLRKDELRLYQIQKNKFETCQKMFSRQPVHPSMTQFTLEEARLLVQGKYHTEDQGDDDEFYIAEGAGNKLNKQVRVRTGDLANEMKLDQFEDVIKNVISESGPDLLAKKVDHIPQAIRDEFNLPEDMSTFKLNYHEVRQQDAGLKRKVSVWSGQDVIEHSLNKKKSGQIIAQVNKVRVWPKGFFKLIKKTRFVLKMFIKLSIFENFLTLAVLLNTISMAMDSYSIEPETQNVLTQLNNVFTWIFIVEMCLRLLAVGVKKYLSDKMSVLDGSVVMLSIIEMVAEAAGGSGGASSLQAFRTVRVFRTFRILRVTRLLRALRSMQVIVGVIGRSFMDFFYIACLMFLFVFIYTLLGRQIFQGKFDFGPDEEKARAHYDTFLIGFVTVFQVLTMENWQQVLFISMRSTRNDPIQKAICAMFYVSWIFIGNFVLLNLFLAILLDSFVAEEDEAEVTEEDIAAQERAVEIRKQIIMKQKERRLKKIGKSPLEIAQKREQQDEEAKKKKTTTATFTGKRAVNEELAVENVTDLDRDSIKKLLIDQGIIKKSKQDRDEEISADIHCENSVYLFNRKSWFRKQMYQLQKHKTFDNFIMLLIFLSSVKLASESYIELLPKDHWGIRVSKIADDITNYLFLGEFLVKMVALGYIMDEGSYMRESWNQLDFFIVLTSMINKASEVFSDGSQDVSVFKVLRLIRMLRPLRVISHNAQLKMIIKALGESVGSIINVSIVVMVVWLMFAIFGMNLYMGNFFYCSIDQYKYEDQVSCNTAGGSWLRFDSNFDNISQAMMTLFIVSSLEGWPDIMYQALDITGRDKGPKFENNSYQCFFFIFFILIGSFFFLNFFIGVLFLKYTLAQKKETQGYTTAQLDWLEIQQMIVKQQCPHENRYKPRHDKNRLRMWHIVQSNTFDIAIMVCIVLNMFQMALDFEGSSQQFRDFIDFTNYIFTTVFFVECVMKLYAYRGAYFKTGWNKFDFFVVASSLVDLGLIFLMPDSESAVDDESSAEALTALPQLARVLRVMRVTRVLRLAGKYKGLQSLLQTIQMSFSSLFYVFALLMLIFFMMATLGWFMFSDVTEGLVISEYKNFTLFHSSFLLLFSISTGEDWNRIMYDTFDTPPFCVQGKTCGTSLAPFYFVAFIMLVTHIMLNLFILVIIQQFEKFYLEEDNPLTRFKDDQENFMKVWIRFTERYQCIKIKENQLLAFFKKLPHSLGMPANVKEAEMKRMMLKMGIVSDNGFIYMNEMLYRIMRRRYGKFRLNKKMLLSEIMTQYTLYTLNMQAQQQNVKGRQEEFFNKYNSHNTSVNPFLTGMYFRTSFNAWLNLAKEREDYAEQERLLEKERRLALNNGLPFNKQAQIKKKEHVYEEVEYEIEEELEWTATSDEELASDGANSRFLKSQNSKSAFRLSRIHGGSTNDVMGGGIGGGGNQRTPHAHRERIKERMKSKESRFMTQSDIKGIIDDMHGKKGKSMLVQQPLNSPQGQIMANKLKNGQQTRNAIEVKINALYQKRKNEGDDLPASMILNNHQSMRRSQTKVFTPSVKRMVE